MEADKLIVKKALDTIALAERQYSMKALGFLDPRERALIEREIRGRVPADMKCEFFGGYDEAERSMMICRPEYLPAEYDEVITVLEISGRDISDLNHRDYLGSLIGLGIKRENIGDIVPDGERCYVYIKPAMLNYVGENLTKIGRRGVRVTRRNLSEIRVPEKPVKPIAATVPSLRLDCVAAAAAGVSRGKAAELVKGERVKLNFEEETSVSAAVNEGDIISIRGFGRFRLSEIRGTTRKGRTAVIIDKYI